MNNPLELPSDIPPTSEVETPPMLPDSSAPSLPTSGRKDARLALYTALGYLAFSQIVLRIHTNQVIPFLISTLLSLGFNLLFTVYAARALRTSRALGLTFALSILVVGPSLLVQILPEWRVWAKLGRPLILYWNTLHIVTGVSGLLLALLAVCIGVGISRMVREFKLLLPMAVVLACVDLYVVFGGGLVQQAQKGSAVAQNAMGALTVQMAAPAARNAAPMAVVGFADFLFIALFFACFVKFRIPCARIFQVLFGVLAAYMLIVFLRNVALPALVPIAVVVIGMNLRRFRFARDELFAMLYAALLCIALGFGLKFYWHYLKARS